MSQTAIKFQTPALLLRSAEQSGGFVFAAILALTSIFVFALFDMRADKIFALPSSIANASAEDLVALWRAARLTLEGAAASAYDPTMFRETLSTQHQGLLWLNPPHTLLLITPLGLLPYAIAKVLWIAVSALCLALIARMTAPRPLLFVAILLSPAAFASLLVMQSGPMIAAALTGALIMSDRRPLLAGFLLALVTMKPQYGFLAAVFLAARGEWRTFAFTVLFSLALAVASAIVFGVEPWLAFFASITGGAHAEHAARLHRDMLTMHQTIGKLGGGMGLRSLAQIAVAAGAVAAVLVAARSWTRDAAIGLTLLLAAFASPSLWVYDWPLVAAGLFMLIRTNTSWPVHMQLAAGALWVAPLISLGFGTMQSSIIAPAIFASALVIAWLWLSGLESDLHKLEHH